MGYIIIILNIAFLFITLKGYYKFHKLSTTLLVIVLLSMAFKNTALIFGYTDSSSIILKAGTSTMILFSFSILVAIIQAGTLSVKYMYLSSVRKLTWVFSFVFMFTWFFVNQQDIITNSIVINYILNNIIEFLIVSLVGIIGLFSFKDKKQWYLLAASSGYFVLLILFYLIGIKSVISFAVCQLVFVSFLVLNENNILVKKEMY